MSPATDCCLVHVLVVPDLVVGWPALLLHGQKTPLIGSLDLAKDFSCHHQSFTLCPNGKPVYCGYVIQSHSLKVKVLEISCYACTVHHLASIAGRVVAATF